MNIRLHGFNVFLADIIGNVPCLMGLFSAVLELKGKERDRAEISPLPPSVTIISRSSSLKPSKVKIC